MIAPPSGYATWLDYAVTNMEMRSLEIDSLIEASFTDLPPHWPEGTTREQMEQAAKAELSALRFSLSEANRKLANYEEGAGQ